ncbi:hypothetical protein B0F90DRAFT_597681 [Multifurca ochricompacta]|uniref:Uncharacterized protein n=1 Tax=Multifurca ochricompacta TaxID=376703 RepID=A0AAD4QMX4_9AGAM|nr:hypothetical protein B0F90DRAFT_597681 [Multifurca ochricompacta]
MERKEEELGRSRYLDTGDPRRPLPAITSPGPPFLISFSPAHATWLPVWKWALTLLRSWLNRSESPVVRVMRQLRHNCEAKKEQIRFLGPKPSTRRHEKATETKKRGIALRALPSCSLEHERGGLEWRKRIKSYHSLFQSSDLKSWDRLTGEPGLCDRPACYPALPWALLYSKAQA